MSYLEKYNLNKKNVLITGGAGGIGEEICKALLEANAKVILADIDEKKSNQTIKKIKKKYKKLFFLNWMQQVKVVLMI